MSMSRFIPGLALLTCLCLAGTAMARPAPITHKPIVAAKFYSGQWYEIARTPMLLTRNCNASTTEYTLQADGLVKVVDACFRNGKRVSIEGRGNFMDPGTNARLRVRYNPLIIWNYWILDHDPAGQWFISSDPTFDKLFIYTRQPPTQDYLDQLLQRARNLGYDTSRLEYPTIAP